MLSALLSGEWAGWLRGSNKRLREVPVHTALAAACRAEVEAALQVPSAGLTAWQGLVPLVTPGLVPDDDLGPLVTSGDDDVTALEAEISVEEGLISDVLCEMEAAHGEVQHVEANAQEAAAAAARDDDEQHTRSSLQGVERLVYDLWQQHQQHQQRSANASIGQQQRKQLPQGLPSSHKQRISAALPVPPPAELQLPSMRQQQQQQQVNLPHTWDVWLPMCPIRTPSAAAANGTAAAPTPPAAAATTDSRQRSPTPGPSGVKSTNSSSGLSSQAAAVSLLSRCVRRRKQDSLYAASSQEYD